VEEKPDPRDGPEPGSDAYAEAVDELTAALAVANARNLRVDASEFRALEHRNLLDWRHDTDDGGGDASVETQNWVRSGDDAAETSLSGGIGARGGAQGSPAAAKKAAAKKKRRRSGREPPGDPGPAWSRGVATAQRRGSGRGRVEGDRSTATASGRARTRNARRVAERPVMVRGDVKRRAKRIVASAREGSGRRPGKRAVATLGVR
jgi:hypothetical protein